MVKKLFTLIAFLTMFMGAKAAWVEVYKIDYSTYKEFPFYVMGYAPEWYDGVMTSTAVDYSLKRENEVEETDNVIGEKTINGTTFSVVQNEGLAGWYQYFMADGIPTTIDGSYRVTAMVKASKACQVNVNMGNWSEAKQTTVQIGTEWSEVEWEYSGIATTSCFLIAQISGDNTTAVIEWQWVKVEENQKQVKPIEWIEMLTNGNASQDWSEIVETGADTKFDDQENNYKICAWSKNMQSEPYPSPIEVVDGDRVFVVHASDCVDPSDGASAWDNQFWIQSPQAWAPGTSLKIHFRYKASQPVKANTQIHKQNPSDYKHWAAIGDINFTTEWQEFDKVISWPNEANNEGWSIAFNLNPEVKDATDFYFDDLSWCKMKLDEGYFVAGADPANGIDYDLDNAIEFTEDPEEEGVLVAIVGTEQEPVSQVMVSTVRGNDAAYKTATLKCKDVIVPEEWNYYGPAGLAKMTLPGCGIWEVKIDLVYEMMCFTMLWGKEVEKLEFVPNPTEFVINALERDWKGADSDGNPTEEGGVGNGQPWDNQMWIISNRALSAGEETYIEFEYMATKDAKASTQCHTEPGNYKHWGAIGDVNFTTEWQKFESSFTVPTEADGMQTIAFNLAEIKEANDYHIKNVIWRTADETESLIAMEGDKHVAWKVNDGSGAIHIGDPAGIESIVAAPVKKAGLYNLAGQKVNKNYKGIVINNGKKLIKK